MIVKSFSSHRFFSVLLFQFCFLRSAKNSKSTASRFLLGRADIDGDPSQSACPGRQGALRARSLVDGAGFGALWEIWEGGKRVGRGGTPGSR